MDGIQQVPEKKGLFMVQDEAVTGPTRVESHFRNVF